MKIATFNVNSLKARLPIVLDWLAAHSPDVLMLQELKGTDLPVMEMTAAGYQVQAVTQKAYNGVATLTRTASSIQATSLLPDDDQARFLDVLYQGVRFLNIYAPNGNPLGSEKYPYKLRWLQALYDRIADLRQSRVDFVVAGDFNIIPEAQDAAHPDQWTGDALYQKEPRALYRAMGHLGMMDALRALHPKDPAFTFWDYQASSFARDNGIRIDHILLSPRLADRLTTCDVDRTPRSLDKPSDHTPVWAEIAL